MTKVSSAQLKGNFAETTVAAWLSRQCLVRRVAEGTDIGIDLYCESLLGESPYKHFWVQVKSIGEKNFEYGGEAWYAFDKKHLEYWARQPIPVYAFLVPVVGDPPRSPEYVFGVRLTERIVREGLPKTKTITYRTSEGFSAESIDEDLSGFIRKIVPFDTAVALLPKGVIAPIDEPEEKSPESFPSDLALIHLDRILSTICFASEILLAELVEARDKDNGLRRKRRLVEKLALIFEDQLNVIGLTAVANSRFLDADADGAKRYLLLARVMIEQTVENPDERGHQLNEIDAMLKLLS